MKYFLIIFTLLFTLPVQAQAVEYYVSNIATGNNDGSDWNNAWQEMNQVDWSIILPGDTVYLAGGSYITDMNVHAEGNQGNPLKIIRAIETDHGTNIGWQNAYDSQVVFEGSRIIISGHNQNDEYDYITIDGIDPKGIYINGHRKNFIDFDLTPGSNYPKKGITIRNLEIEGWGMNLRSNPDYTDYCLDNIGNTQPLTCKPQTGACEDILIDNVFFHDIPTVAIHMGNGGCRNCIIQNCEFSNIKDESTLYGENCHNDALSIYNSKNMTIRNNKFHEINAQHIKLGGSGNQEWYIYGNVHWQDYNGPFSGGAFGISGDSGGLQQDINVYNNVYSNIYNLKLASGSTAEFRNNIFHDMYAVSISGFDHSHNHYVYTDNNIPSLGSGELKYHEDVFVDIGNHDFRLNEGSTPIDSGTSLESDYSTDPDGNIRGADGSWDIGAFEYTPEPSCDNCHYIRQGSSGDGSDWNNAWGSFSQIDWSQVSPGDILYVASGQGYDSISFQKSGTSTDWIEIRRATRSDHGTSFGWSDSMDGDCVFSSGSSINPNGNHHLIVNGVTEYGFQLHAAPGEPKRAITISQGEDDLIFKYIWIDGTNNNEDFRGVYRFGGGLSERVTFSHIKFTKISNDCFVMDDFDDWIIEYITVRNKTTSTIGKHGDLLEVRSGGKVVLRYSDMEWWGDHLQTGILGHPSGPWYVYGNIFRNANSAYKTNSRDPQGNGPIHIYNNVIVNSRGAAIRALSTPTIIKNNIFRDNENNGDTGTSSYVDGTDPFVDYIGKDFHLDPSAVSLIGTAEVIANIDGQTFDIDPDGILRGSSWDIGAFEYSDTGCSCGTWIDGACQEGSCTTGQREQTRTCTPSACSTETQCITDPVCDIICSTDQDCDDSNPCTDDTCNSPGTQSSSCQYTPNSGSCSDSNSCTTGDACSGGICSGTPITQCSMVSDSCCPSGCDETTDPDCSSICQNLVALYNFEGNAQDSSGNGNDGTPNNPTLSTSQTGYGEAYNFDGTDDYIDLGGLDIPGSELTISMWVNPDDFGVYDARLISKSTSSSEQDHYWMLSTFSNQVLRARLKTGGSTSTLIAPTGSIPAGTWSHAAFTYDGTEMKLYLNGQEVGSLAKTGAPDTNPAVNAYIGLNPGGHGPFDGLIDDVAIFSRSLTLEEIQEIHSKGQTLSCQTHQAYHPTDLDNSCTIELSELNAYITLWHYDSTANPMNTLMESLAYYYSPGYC